MVVHAHHPSTPEAEAGGLLSVLGQLGLQSRTLSEKKEKKGWGLPGWLREGHLLLGMVKKDEGRDPGDSDSH